MVPSPDRPPLKRLRITSDLEAQNKSALIASPIPFKGKGGKGKQEEDLRGRLEKILAKARSGAIAAAVAIYESTDELI